MKNICLVTGCLAQVLGVALLVSFLMPLDASLLAREPERWSCDIDFHQGDAGRLEFERTEAGIRGSLTVRRGSGAAQASAIEGSWGREVIRFTRASSGADGTFIGIGTGTDARQIKMAGRFGAGFDGIWSATCVRGATTDGALAPGSPTPLPPSPSTPTTKPGSCAITVNASGARADLAKLYQLVLRGPDSMTAVKGRQPFGSGHVTFPDLPDGRYLLTLDTKADVSVTISPRRHDVVCSGGAAVEKVFEFR